MSIIHKAIVFLSFIILLALSFFIPESSDRSFQYIVFIIVLINTFSLYFFQKKIFNKFGYINFLSIFILGYLIVFFQLPLLSYFGIEIIDSLFDFIWVHPNVINKSILISGIGLVSFYFGFIYYKKSPLIQKSNLPKRKLESSNFLVNSTYIIYLIFFISSGSYKTGEYTPDDSYFLLPYFFKYFNVFLTASIIHRLTHISSLSFENISISKYLSLFDNKLLIIIFWHIAFSLFVGDRGPIISYGLLTFSLYFLRFNRVGFVKIILLIVLSGIVFESIGIIRMGRKGNVNYSQRVNNAFSSNEKNSKGFDRSVPGSSFIELALSVRTLNHSIYNVPKNYEYGYGTYQLSHIFSIIPGLSGLMIKIIHDGDQKFDSSSSFITFLIQGNNPTYGDGTSVLADFYLDYGLMGVIFGLFLFGVFIGKNEYKLYYGYQKISISWVLILVYFSLAIYLSRSSLLLPFGRVVMVYIVLLINTNINKKNNLV